MPSFFLKDPAPPELSPLPLPAPLPIKRAFAPIRLGAKDVNAGGHLAVKEIRLGDRKSTRLNSSHGYISYAVFFFKGSGAPRALPSSPTRPSSDQTSFRADSSRCERRQRRRTSRGQGNKARRSEEHTSELQSRLHIVCRLFF